jgi:ASPIC/UnbV protein/VCBS repeat protein
MKLFSSLFICLPILFIACKQKHTLFEKISSSHSGIHFNNKITETDSINPLNVVNIYNGGGVGVGDFNNDGLQDLYFSGNMVPCKLYLNRGNFQFEDITDKAGVGGMGRWARGVSIVDINNDGLLDIYICNTIYKDSLRRRNILYVNQGIDKDGIPHFKDMAAEYGLDIHVQSTMASFFDYDNDGDLDMYLAVNEASSGYNSSVFARRFQDSAKAPSRGRLFRNDMDPGLKHPLFHDVSDEAGVKYEGYGHAATICDINKDGWKDIYVSDDFLSNNILYINNHDGTFTNKAKQYFKHTSLNSMGQDVIDINNDGLPDVIELDMNPEDNFRKKTMLSGGNYHTDQNYSFYGYQFQYVRNTLQLNQGSEVNQNDSIGDPTFSDVSFFSGMAETDWSWTPLVADFDNDGSRDLIVTNGFPRDVTDHDFIAFRTKSSGIASDEYVLSQIPRVKLRNYAFRNIGNARFDNVNDEWGLNLPSFSNGAVYADLDNDGDLDMIVNNINDEAFVYENTTNTKKESKPNYLKIKFKGDRENVNGLGAWAEIYYNKNQMQVYENSPYRGYLSTMECGAFFGLGNISSVDSVIIRWPPNKKQVLKNVKADQLVIADIKNANLPDSWNRSAITSNVLFSDITNLSGIKYSHQETDFIDFDRERLIPHKLSQFGPGLAAGDIDGNGLDDICLGGSSNFTGKLFLQQADGKFIMKDMPETKEDNKWEDMGLLLFDADGDGDLDLFCASGSNEFPANNKNYQDHLLINDGNGNFSLDSSALPSNYTSKSCVKAVDFDNDGDLDLFIGGRCLPGQYPLPVSSFIYRNDSKNGKIIFTDVTAEVAPFLKNIGMVCDAVWTDFDNDGWTDLVMVGEWMPITVLKNNHGKFENVTAQSGVSDQTGWWNSVAAGDFDNDGDIDYIVGNLGENSFFRASDKFPVSVYAKDFDNNGSIDPIMTIFLKDQHGAKKEYPVMSRDDIISELPALKKKFLTYKEFANADIHQIFPDEQMKGALILRANNLKSCYVENKGSGKFELHPLPGMAQLAPVNGIVVDDFNNDGNLDVAISGNDFGNEVFDGRYDAMNGLVLLGNGKGNFVPQTIMQSGIFIPGDAKALIKLRGQNNSYLLAASQNRGPLRIFAHKNSDQKFIPVQQTDRKVFITLSNGQKREEEIYFGNSFMSQSSRFLCVGRNVRSVEIKDANGKTRPVNLQ